jgi:hypothetical protein
MSFAFNFSFGVGMGSNGVGQAPINDIAPVVSGLLTTGSTLSCTTGTWSGAPTITYAYQWRRGGVDIGGATSSTYVLVVADMYNNIDCLVTATNAFGSGQAPSNSVFASEEFSDVFGANYLFDWNPDVSASVSTSGGGALDSIASVGLNTAAFTQTGAARPQLVANQINGKPVIRFDGATSWMDIASSTALFNFLHNSTGGTVIIVSKVNVANPDAVYSFINNSGGATTEIGFSINYSDQTSLGRNNNIVSNISRGVSGTYAVTNLSANDYFDTLQFNSLICISDPANATAADRSSLIVNSGAAVKNNALTNAPSSANATQNITLGRTAVFGPFFLNGDIARIIIVDAKATPTQQAQVAARLAFEYGTFPI